MRGTREIKRRIRSVQSTQKITRAMEMVAAAKLRRAEEKAQAARPYAQSIKSSIARILQESKDIKHPLMEKNDSPVKCIVVFSSDRGLCGSYNTNVIRKAAQEVENMPLDQVAVVAIGRKARDHFRRREYNVIGEYLDMEDRPGLPEAQEIGAYLSRLFLDGSIGEAWVLYSEFVNVMVNRPRAVQLLPMDGEKIQRDVEEMTGNDEVLEEKDETDEKVQEQENLYRFEPEPELVLDALLPRLVYSQFYTALLEAKASEFGSRMTAMKMATENAKEMIWKLTLAYNKARQAAITQEILEIVNTSEALSSG